jgi:PII-like signaling protein
MHLPEKGSLLRIFIGEADRHNGKPLYEWIVYQAREQGLAGATVLRGVLGFGANTRQIHTFKIEALSSDLPVIVEIIDRQENLEKFLDLIVPMIPAGLVTMELADVKFYRATKS